mmetsp:Transcript_11741/g.18949  ORF Transcript_11741/g.18949 Transcript_11741/m.18949 type:complete len:503 (+) Transcript_11741:425-1933(+)|eukprot:CAMPEP_0171496284 /NCGR_PEP_ID=MMETSP0958-20121227/6614_1 /TAXON_ID=87120 /ORGANISM="Aurantiochytrium limacinum, Strain ATCCMYA-1381" /LENGTH=502 /DNA_ID=CAMNT_0012030365 /DNA_START=384 /DNA_END=1892 /DNA_ORIENTATION=+
MLKNVAPNSSSEADAQAEQQQAQPEQQQQQQESKPKGKESRRKVPRQTSKKSQVRAVTRSKSNGDESSDEESDVEEGNVQPTSHAQDSRRANSAYSAPRQSIQDANGPNRPHALGDLDIDDLTHAHKITSMQQIGSHEVVFYPGDFDGEIVWHARQQRKGRYPAIESHDKNVKIGRTVVYLLSYEPGNVSWWVAHTFAWGSVLFVVGGANLFWPGSFSDGYFFGEVSAFLGALLFQFGGYFALLEAINPRRELELGYRVRRMRRKYRKNNKDDQSPAAQDTIQRRIEFISDDEDDIDNRPQRPWKWIALDFSDCGKRAASVQFIGTTIYLGTLILGLPRAGTGGAETLVPYDNMVLYDIFMWGGLALGSICFMYVGTTLTLECQYAWYVPNIASIGWWVNFFYFIGACGFMLNAFFGWFYMGRDGNEVCCQHFGTNLSTFWGSCAFLASSVCMAIECANKHPIPPPSFLVNFSRPADSHKQAHGNEVASEGDSTSSDPSAMV